MNEEQVNQQEFMNRLRDVEMDVTVRFGLTEMPLRDVAALGGGSMIELNRTIEEPVELLINGLPFARGEVVVVDGYYSVRVTEVSPPEKHPNTFFVGANRPGDDESSPGVPPPGKNDPANQAPKPPSQQAQPAPQQAPQAQKPAQPKAPSPPPAKPKSDQE